ncbi:hypothetical protein VTN00DRAFT_1175 [Thermoascus crustaceus]|uniref:uncharacterized protein n=1 Tax=Thermoascus crustaceus TaxID=5088 RepID=UPI0037440278
MFSKKRDEDKQQKNSQKIRPGISSLRRRSPCLVVCNSIYTRRTKQQKQSHDKGGPIRQYCHDGNVTNERGKKFDLVIMFKMQMKRKQRFFLFERENGYHNSIRRAVR